MEDVDDSRFLVSGWDDDLEDLDEGRNPKGTKSQT